MYSDSRIRDQGKKKKEEEATQASGTEEQEIRLPDESRCGGCVAGVVDDGDLVVDWWATASLNESREINVTEKSDESVLGFSRCKTTICFRITKDNNKIIKEKKRFNYISLIYVPFLSL